MISKNGFFLIPEEEDFFILIELDEGELIATDFLSAKNKEEALKKAHSLLNCDEIPIEFLEEDDYPQEEDVKELIRME